MRSTEERLLPTARRRCIYTFTYRRADGDSPHNDSKDEVEAPDQTATLLRD